MSNSLYVKMLSCLFLVCLTTALVAQTDMETIDTENEMLGDNFSLEGALEIFKASESLEDFETKINNEDNSINNLDLNEDGEVDYIRVIDNMDSDVHAIVLQALLSEEESQDVAVIEMEKTGAENVILQIAGDELLYGDKHFVEPFEEAIEQSKKGGPNGEVSVSLSVANVWKWTIVRSIFRPNYRPYVSPWRWNYYPRVWRPWSPLTIKVFRPRLARHRVAYRVVPTHRVVRAHRIYTPRRVSSKRIVSRRTAVRHNSKVKRHNTKKVAKKKRGKSSKAKRGKKEKNKKDKKRARN